MRLLTSMFPSLVLIKKNGDWTETVQGEEVKVRIKGGKRSSD